MVRVERDLMSMTVLQLKEELEQFRQMEQTAATERDEARETIDALDHENQSFQAQLQEQKEQLAAAEAENEELYGSIEALKQEKVDLTSTIDALDAENQQHQQLLAQKRDSIDVDELRNQLQAAAGGQSLPSTLVFDHPTARQLASLLQPKQSTGVAATSLGNALVSTGAGVGIDGMSALLPSGASSPWMATCMVGCGWNAIVQVPAARWNVHAQMMLPEPIASRVRHTGFVRGAELADNAVFAVSPAEAAAMDPCQRLVLEFGYAALHDAPLDRTELGGSLTGFFLGFSGTEFAQVLRASPAGGSVYCTTGSAHAVACGRVLVIHGGLFHRDGVTLAHLDGRRLVREANEERRGGNSSLLRRFFGDDWIHLSPRWRLCVRPRATLTTNARVSRRSSKKQSVDSTRPNATFLR